MRHHQVDTNGVRLHVVTAGPPDGPAALLLHGFPEYWAGWSRQIGPLADAGYHVIVPDQRGYGASDKPRGLRAYQIDAIARDAVGLLDHFGVAEARVLCHDWGGAIGWWMAQRYAERVERLCVLNMPHPKVMQRHLRGPRQLARSWYMGLFQLPRLPEALLRAGDHALLERALRRHSAADPFTADELDGYHRAWREPGALRGMLAWYRALRLGPGDRPSHPRVRCPTLLVWGRRDAALGWRMAEDSLAMCDDARLVFIDEAAHFVQHDAPARVNAEVLGFFAGGSAGP